MGHVIALSGGVGGAKLAFGLARVLPPEDLTIVVNTGDDFDHLGLRVCPDIDSVTYALAGLSDRERGWGLTGETWGFMSALKRLGGEDWFNLGDHDLATHVERTRRLADGQSLSQVTTALAAALGLANRIAPMSDDPVRTWVESSAGRLSFQDYFVRHRCAPVVRALEFVGAKEARLSKAFAEALGREDLSAIVICPSNPYLSIDPILAVAGVSEAICKARCARVAVSPIVGGQALKGPAAKLMAELGVRPGNAAVADHYRGSADGLVIDRSDVADRSDVECRGLAVLAVDSVMVTDEDRTRLARDCLAFAARLARPKAEAG